MKLLSLYVCGYKNLNDVRIDFSKSKGKTLLVGMNGSGKSNLLEIVSAIFSAVYNRDKDVIPHFNFELEYVIEHIHNSTAKAGNSYQLPMYVRLRNPDGIILMEAHSADSDWEIIGVEEFDSLLPEHVVAVYSGEEKRLWENYYFQSYEEYNKQYMSGKISYQSQKMVYLNKYYWNLVASILAIHDISECVEFLNTAIGLNEIYGIYCKFDVDKIKANRNTMVEEMLNIINPEKKEEIDVTLSDYNRLKDVCGYESDIFYNMAVLALYKDFKIITELTIKCKGGIEIKDLSEGEKKLLLIYGAITIISGENLYLLDEPDAHLHEGRKREIFDLISQDYESHFIITSHSPTLTKLFDYDHVVMLEKEEGNCKVYGGDISKIISLLTNNEWNYIEHTIFLNKSRPLLLVEGSGDISYISKAIDIFSKENEKYKILQDMDMLHSGGAANMKGFINELKKCLPEHKQVIVLFDCDTAGGDAMKALIGKGSNRRERTVYKKEEFFYLKLPKVSGFSKEDFVIEDYFSQSLKKNIAQSILDNSGGEFNELPKDVKQSVKERLAKDIDSYDSTTMQGFKVLLDKLCNIIEGTEAVVPV